MKYTLGNSRLEVNGKQYLKDVGGYNGTNKDSSKDVATVIGGKIDSMLSVNYFELVNLRDNGKLIPGQQYRITDYITTTVQENTESAGHQFDIIVTANSNNTLNEIASACLHEGDTYFSRHKSNLSAWQIWYCLDNDNSRFEWAMKYSYDSDNNLYEFDNWVTAVGKVCDDQINTFYETEINEKFSHYGYSEDLDGIQILTLYGRNLDGDIDEGLNTNTLYHYKGVYNVDGKEYDGWAQLVIKDDGSRNYAVDKDGNYIYILTERTAIGKGVIYRMIDEYGNDCPYDFKNIKFTKPIFSETDTPDSNFYYTFSYYESYDSSINDCSVYNNVAHNVYDNVIKPYYYFGGGDQILNRILFIISDIYIGTIAKNTFGTQCYDNTFGTQCYDNTFGNDCYNNKFGNSCYDNTFGSSCHNNTFGTNCYDNTFGTNCYSNTFGNNCDYNIFGTRSSRNGEITTKSYYRNIIFDNGNNHICLNCDQSTDSSKYYQNVRIGLGVNNSTTYKTITDSNVNQDYERLYIPTGSDTKTV